MHAKFLLYILFTVVYKTKLKSDTLANRNHYFSASGIASSDGGGYTLNITAYFTSFVKVKKIIKN